MNKLRQPFRMLTTLLCFITIGVYGQKQTKTFNENFNVSKDAVLDISTSHSDIEFETWSKNEVGIEATIEIVDATDEEAKAYFENSGFEIIGNGAKVSIKTGSKNSGLWPHALGDMQNFQIEIPELHDFNFGFDFEELSNIPIPPMAEFDHKAFKEDGEIYLKDWQKKFQDSYDEDYLKKLEEWAKRMEEKRELAMNKREEMLEKREKMHEKRADKLTERHEKMIEVRAKRMEAQNERREKLLELRTRGRFNKDSIVFFSFNNLDSIQPSIFYSNSDGLHKNFKVKKTIKVKMPKGMKIKMNVRHGEVKLAENTKNINATLSHSSLWASTIDGDKTTINASYSPVSVQTWNYGQLQAKYSENVALKEVLNLRLNATSSNVTIDQLIHSAFIKSDFGPLEIKSVSNNFKDIDITLQNGELNCKLPNVPFAIYVNGTSSKLTTPETITLDRTKNHNNTIHKGYYKNENSDSSIVINSKYSEVVID